MGGMKPNIQIAKHSGIYTLYTEQLLNVSLVEAWDFFSSPGNLKEITPKHMSFKVTSSIERKAYPGQIVTYRIGVLPGIKVSWVTELTKVVEQQYFVDEQRFGPYSMWHHEHWFEETEEGKTLMKDKVSYKIPFGPLGHLAQQLFIKKQLHGIFEYRYEVLAHRFNGVE